MLNSRLSVKQYHRPSRNTELMRDWTPDFVSGFVLGVCIVVVAIGLYWLCRGENGR